MSELLSSSCSWNYDCFCEEFSILQQEFNNYYCFNGINGFPFGDELSGSLFRDEFSVPKFTESSRVTFETLPFSLQEDTPISILGNEEHGLVTANDGHDFEKKATCKDELIQSPDPPEVTVLNIGSCPGRKVRGKKLDGQPSKNLMAERRRRKRLNDRLSLLRSIVPKISKMDRTSILADTIDYIKELSERIKFLQQEIQVGKDSDELKDIKSSEIVVRNSPKFNVERRNAGTRIEICCAGKPGLLLSTVKTLEALGVEIQQCVISCFNEFSMQASCSEELDRRVLMSSEEIKQALFASAGYEGRCM
ncbi:hypothetical protein K2173_007888 [Erythroxylum novogranatense]|uniref:BHLH domain-containing protein n=1 Tax=Erythroxylum novogranatense TaxID=1862640 RepID=A0AAV8T8Q2_9ROSI|nr:hypothetical protein K2173_007888 [Erythroxylum novogranatense]